MSVELTERGAGLAAVAAALAALYAATGDPLLALALALAALPLVLDLAYLALGPGRASCSAGPRVERRLWPWERPVVELAVACSRGRARLDEGSLPAWLHVLETVPVDGAGVRVRARLAPAHYGVYRLQRLLVVFEAPLGLLRLRRGVEARVELRVLPETLYRVLEALGLLGLGGLGAWPGEGLPAPWALRSMGGEYYETREYVPGDLPRRIDWKATARTQRLMVRDYREAPAGGLALVFDTRCRGPATCDAVASAALSAAVAAVRQGEQPLLAYDLSRGRIIAHSSPRVLLAYLLDRILESEAAERLELYEYAEPLTSREVLQALRGLAGRAGVVPAGPLEAVDALARPGRTFIASMVLHMVRDTLDLVDALRRRGVEVVVAMPAKPWLDAESLEEAYRVYRSAELVARKLRRMGVELLPWRSRGHGV